MPLNLNTCGVFAMTLFGVANAHMKMVSPVPFNVANLDNSPLKSDGSDFPCKASKDNPASYSISAMNNMPVNEPILLSFEGSAVHGGGTCQVSITFDEKPTAQSVWKVIQTFEGPECPSATGGGLTFNIPKDFPNAEKATLGWTWFNRVGNREMYMNCAPISITGGSDSKDYYESLPPMFVANVPATDCTTTESTDATVPNPGEFVLKGTGSTPGLVTGPKCGVATQNKNAQSGGSTNLAAFSAPATDSNKIVPVGGSGEASQSVPAVGGGGASSAGSGGFDDGMYHESTAVPVQTSSVATSPLASSAPASSSDTIATSSAATSAAAPTASAPALSSSTFSTFTIPASGSGSAPAYSAPAASAPATSVAAPPAYPTLSPSMGQGVSGPSSGSTASPTGSSPSSTNSCPTDGTVVCSTDGTQFGLCDHGSVVFQTVAAGTKCSNGTVQKRSAHVRRHAHGAYKVRASWT